MPREFISMEPDEIVVFISGETRCIVATLDPDLDVEVLEWSGDWARVRCSNGWEAWIDGRPLIPVWP